MNATIPPPARNLTRPCGCVIQPWCIVPAATALYATPLPERGVGVYTVLCDETPNYPPYDRCCSLVMPLLTITCPFCGTRGPFAGDCEAIRWQRHYDPALVTVAGLGEAHEAVVAQVRAGVLP